MNQKEKNNESAREKVHHNAKKALIRNNYNGILRIAPRVGKTKIVLNTLDGAKSNIYVSSPFSAIRSNWVKEKKKWKTDVSLVSICHRSLGTIPENLPILVIDELQTLSVNQLKIIQSKKPQRILALTGFMSTKTEMLIRHYLGLDTVFEYSIQDAIDDGVISDFEIDVITVPLDDKDAYHEMKGYVLTEAGLYGYYSDMFEVFRVKAQQDYKLDRVKMMFANRRQNFIYTAKYKLGYAKQVMGCEEFAGRKMIIFTGRIEGCDELGVPSYHSGNYEDDNLHKFIDGTIDRCSVIQMVNMGITILGLKLALIHQAQSNPEMAVQRILRACNLEDLQGKARIIMLCYKDTVDEAWVKESLDGIPADKIRFSELKQDEDICSLLQKMSEQR